MAQITYSAAPKEVGQAWNRVSRNWPDQHGRIWNGVVSTKDKSGHPCSPVTPVDWTAPMIPAAKYMRYPRMDEPFPKLTIDYAAWVADLDQYTADWDKQIDNACLGFANGNQQLYARLRRNPTTAILQMAGAKPLDRRYVLACEAGDPWALGLSPTFPAWAAKIWGTPDKVDPTHRSAANDYTFLDDAEDRNALKQETQRRRRKPVRRPPEDAPHG